MEAAGFYAAASRFSTAELIHCFKVISDSKEAAAQAINAKFVQQLIEQNVPLIEQVAASLIALEQKLPKARISREDMHKFLQRWHLTSTQQHRLRNLLERWQVCSAQSPDDLWTGQLVSLSHVPELFDYLEQKIRSLPLHFSREDEACYK